METKRYRFRPPVWATLVAVGGIVLTLALGNWQMHRARYKEDLQNRQTELARQAVINMNAEEINPDALVLRRVYVTGEYDPSRAVYLDNRVYKHQAGLHVIMPLRLTGSNRYVLVNRGWVAAERERGKPPVVKTPDGVQKVSGIAVAPSGKFIELSGKVAEGAIWQNLALDRYKKSTGLDVLPVIVLQTDAMEDGLIRDWPPPDLGRNTHLAYAVQWFALSIAILIYYVVVNVRRRNQA